jgi:Fe-S-cluster-containing hydrogenase component 2
MGQKDLYEDLCKYWEFMLGPLPRRAAFKQALEDLVTPEDLALFFQVSFSGHTTLKKLKKKAKMPAEELTERLDRLVTDALLLPYESPEGPTYERLDVIYFSEHQIRKPGDTSQHIFYAEFFDELTEQLGTAGLPFKTAGFRVLPVEETVTGESQTRTIALDAEIPDRRQAIPFDVVSEIIKREEAWIAVSDCYCRKAKTLLGKGCEHPVEVCFVFNEFAEGLVERGVGRKIGYDEAMQILRKCEEAGLVHHIDNCVEDARTLCNCCSCACSPLRISELRQERGQPSVIAPSRYVVKHDTAKCTHQEDCVSRCPTHARSIRNGRVVMDPALCEGCGLCVTACTQGANRMIPRKHPPKVPQTFGRLYGKMGREALLGMAKNKILRR